MNYYMEFSITTTSKCIKCNEYYINKNNLCSQCYYKEYNSFVSNDSIINVTLKLKYEMEQNLAEYYNEFCNLHNIKRKILCNNNEFRILKNILNNKLSGEVFVILSGKGELPAYALTSKHIYELLLLFESFVPEKELYKYHHAIGPFMYDPWNVKCNNELYCHYIINNETIPTTKEKLFSIWSRMIIPPYVRTYISKHKMDECKICLNAIFTIDTIIKCKKCNNIVHLQCCSKYLTNSNDVKCLNCQFQWKMHKITSIDYNDVWIINGIIEKN